jgi:hypothetical protein
MVAGHQNASRGSADGIATVVIHELYTLGGHAIEIRRADVLLAVAAEIATPEIIREDEDHIGLTSESRCGEQEEDKEGFHGREAGNADGIDFFFARLSCSASGSRQMT